MNLNVVARLSRLVVPAIAFGLLAASGVRAQSLVVKGSDTMVNLSQAWAEAYMAKNPRAKISVTGGGSGTGIAGLINGSCDLANSSRAMKAKEIASCKSRGFVPKGYVTALDGLAVSVNAANPVRTLSIPQIAGIYTGRITDWSQVGGKAGRIVVLSRESNSGTFTYFKEVVLGNANYSPSALLMPSTKAIAQELANNPNAIGYGGEAYFRHAGRVRILPVSHNGGAGIMPSDATVQNKSYPISRPLFVYTHGSPSPLASAFIRFCMSPEGQAIVTKVGYTRLP